MKKYFSQFGRVTNLRLSRSAKTGGSRGYAFIEFESEDVAKIVADTMDGYLFFNKILKCSVVPKEKVHEGLFRHFRYPFPLRKEVVRTVHNRPQTLEGEKRSAQRRLLALERTKARLRKMGVRCDFDPQVPSELLQPLDTSSTAASQAEEESGFSLLVDSSDDSISLKTPVGARKVRKVKKKSRGSKGGTPLLKDVTPGRPTTPASPKKPSDRLLASLGSGSRRRGRKRTSAASTPASPSKMASPSVLNPTSTPKETSLGSSSRKRRKSSAATPASSSKATPVKTPTLKATPTSQSKRKKSTPSKKLAKRLSLTSA